MSCTCVSIPAGAQLGIIFDTDVDRSAVVDGDGTPINSNRFIALMAAIVLQVSLAADHCCI
jgi:phosphomannomutase